MYCPNCGKENASGRNYCRTCGLKLDAVAKAVAEILPSEENAALQRRKRVLEKLGRGALLIAGLIAVMTFIFAAALYKLILFGPEVLFLASAIALAVFATLGAGMIGYSKLFIGNGTNDGRAAPIEGVAPLRATGKLIEDRPFEPIPSVAENTTDLLPRKLRSDKN